MDDHDLWSPTQQVVLARMQEGPKGYDRRRRRLEQHGAGAGYLLPESNAYRNTQSGMRWLGSQYSTNPIAAKARQSKLRQADGRCS